MGDRLVGGSAVMAKRSQSATSELLARRHLLVEGFSRTTADAVGSAFEGALIARRALLVAGFAGEIFSGDGSAETTGLMLPERLCRIAATFGIQDAAAVRSISATCDDLADSTVSPTDGTAARQTRAWQP